MISKFNFSEYIRIKRYECLIIQSIFNHRIGFLQISINTKYVVKLIVYNAVTNLYCTYK